MNYKPFRVLDFQKCLRYFEKRELGIEFRFGNTNTERNIQSLWLDYHRVFSPSDTPPQ